MVTPAGSAASALRNSVSVSRCPRRAAVLPLRPADSGRGKLPLTVRRSQVEYRPDSSMQVLFPCRQTRGWA
jgi:hypothetical protein